MRRFAGSEEQGAVGASAGSRTTPSAESTGLALPLRSPGADDVVLVEDRSFSSPGSKATMGWEPSDVT